MSSTVGELLDWAASVLGPNPDRRREPRLLLARRLGKTEASVLAHSELAVDSAVRRTFMADVERRSHEEPIAYILGEREFYGRPFLVDERVLVPRPETEHLAEIAIETCPEGGRVLDLGTGSGCLAVTVAAERPDCRVVAVDLSPGAAAVAQANARSLGVSDRVAILVGSWVDALSGAIRSFDTVISNPPYVAEDDPSLAPDVRRWEPSLALFAAGGLAAIRTVLSLGATARPGARLLLEVGQGQARATAQIGGANGWVLERIVPDLAGIERIVVLRRPVPTVRSHRSAT